MRLPVRRYRGIDRPGQAAKLRDELSMSWLDAYALRFSGLSPSLRAWLQPDVDIRDSYLTHSASLSDDPLQALLAVDMDHYLPEYILRKADLCTMAHGLELRVPLLDHRLYQAVLGMSRKTRFTDPAKQALASECGICSRLHLSRRPKRGFNPPVDQWLRGPLAPRLIGLGEGLAAATGGQMDGRRVERFVQAWKAGQGPKAEQILQLLMLTLSLQQLHALP